MNPVNGVGKTLIVLGIIFIIIGVLFLNRDKLPWLGRLPGDIYIKKEGLQIYIPITTCLIVSLLLTLLLRLFRR